MNFLSCNVRGLTNLSKKYYVQDTCHRLHGNLDFLCLQEVKISGFMISFSCHVTWPNNIIFSSQHEASRSGVVTLLSPCLNSAIILHGSDPMQRIIWIFLFINNHSFGIVNVYVPNDVVERS